MDAITLILEARDRMLVEQGLLQIGSSSPEDYQRVAKHIIVQLEMIAQEQTDKAMAESSACDNATDMRIDSDEQDERTREFAV